MRAEVRRDAEREHVDLDLVHQAGELLDLGRRVELGLVADQVVDRGAAHALVDHEGPEVGVVADLVRGDLESQARGQAVGPGTVVAREDQSAPTPRGVVVVELEGEGGLAAVHRPGEEDELSHGRGPFGAGEQVPGRR
ncbi:hypothetical protein D3C74_414770 [compost metagenome]